MKIKYRFIIAGLCVTALALHFALVFYHYPPSSAVNAKPLVSGDLVWHVTSATEGNEIIKGQGHIWGYSPNFMAGYPFGLWSSVSKRGYEFATTLFPFLGLEAAFYSWLILTVIIPPLLIPLACLLVKMDQKTTFVSFLLSLFVYHFQNHVSYFWSIGMSAFVFASALSIVCVALYSRMYLENTKYLSVPLGVTIGVAFWIHPLVAPMLIMSFACVFLQNPRRLLEKDIFIKCIISACIAILIMLPWATILIKHWHMQAPMTLEVMKSGVKDLIMDFFSDRGYQHPYDRRLIFHVIIILGGLGCWNAYHRRQKHVLALAISAFVILISAYAFSFSSFLSATQPYRYVSAAVLFAIIPATVGLLTAGNLFISANMPGRVLCLLVLAASIPSLSAYLIDLQERKPMRSLTNEEVDVVNWIGETKSAEGRILCELGRVGSVIPYFTGRETIGGTYSAICPLIHSYASIGSKYAFGQEKIQMTPDDWKHYIELFNISCLVVESEDTAAKLEQCQDICTEVFNTGRVRIFKVKPELASFIMEKSNPQSKVTAKPNQILIENAPPGKFTLKYHFLDSLTVSEGCEIFPVEVAGAKLPFIGVNNHKELNEIKIWQTY